MADYFVSTQDGSDSTGTGTATNPWKTVNKAIGSSPAMPSTTTAPTTLHIEPGVYWGEAVMLGVTASASYPLTIRGDYDGSAFAAGGKSNPRTGVVDWRAWTNATTKITGGCLSVRSGRGYVTLERLKLIGGNATPVDLIASGPLTVRDCVIVGNAACFWINHTSTYRGLTIERCRLAAAPSNYGAIYLAPSASGSAWDAAVAIRDCEFFNGGNGVAVAFPDTRMTGVSIQGCAFFSGTRGVYSTGTGAAGAVTVNGCWFSTAGYGIVAAHSGDVVEDGNTFADVDTPRTNVSAGSNSVAGVFPAFNFGDGMIDGSRLRPFTEPVADSPAIGFGRYGTPSATDLFGRTRPASPAAVAAGALERAADPPGPACPPVGNAYIFQVEG